MANKSLRGSPPAPPPAQAQSTGEPPPCATARPASLGNARSNKPKSSSTTSPSGRAASRWRASNQVARFGRASCTARAILVRTPADLIRGSGAGSASASLAECAQARAPSIGQAHQSPAATSAARGHSQCGLNLQLPQSSPQCSAPSPAVMRDFSSPWERAHLAHRRNTRCRCVPCRLRAQHSYAKPSTSVPSSNNFIYPLRRLVAVSMQSAAHRCRRLQ